MYFTTQTWIEIGFIVILLAVLLWGFAGGRKSMVEMRQADVAIKTYEAEYGPIDTWDR